MAVCEACVLTYGFHQLTIEGAPSILCFEASCTIIIILLCFQKSKQTTTVKDKSFEGEKFHGLLGSSGMWGKVS